MNNPTTEPSEQQSQIINYNPDVLSCLANLSNDEVFTPPALVNQMLDTLPIDLWCNAEAKFLDPVTKSGVFLREIAKRLIHGLETQIPDLQTRINHVFKNQLYGIAITELTSLLARRSVYCAKTANSRLSICDAFDDTQGNIRYTKMTHTWRNGKCTYCGASQEVYDRDEVLESHAYQFIHTDNPAEQFGTDMKFDVIIGNPPYQLSDGGFGRSASPIYHKFVEQAKKINPRFLIMIVPARWYSGGKGLDDFRQEMLNDQCIKEIHDYADATDVFPGVQIKGGICIFKWESGNPGKCKVTSFHAGSIRSILERPLLEDGADTFIRYNEAISIVKKVTSLGEISLKNIISSSKPFGFRTNYFGSDTNFDDSVILFQNGGIGYIERDIVEFNVEVIDKYKVFIPPLGSGSDSFPHSILGKPFIGTPNSVCTETYIYIGTFSIKSEAEHLISYLSTKFLRFLVLLNKPAQHATKKVYHFVPMQDFSEPWSDEKLYAKYGLSPDEIAFIESMIRPMDLSEEVSSEE